MLTPALAHDPQFRSQFDREANSIAALNHSHICTLYDIGFSDGVDYLVIECMEGETLATRLRARCPAVGSGPPLTIQSRTCSPPGIAKASCTAT